MESWDWMVLIEPHSAILMLEFTHCIFSRDVYRMGPVGHLCKCLGLEERCPHCTEGIRGRGGRISHDVSGRDGLDNLCHMVEVEPPHPVLGNRSFKCEEL